MLIRLQLHNSKGRQRFIRRSHRRGGGGDGGTLLSATKLAEAGIRIGQSKSRSLTGIEFQGGTLKLPRIIVDDSVESLYLNTMAFERLHVGAGNEVTSFVFFMSSIILSARDAALLQSRGVIHNAVGNDQAVANLFNSLSKDVAIDPDSPLVFTADQIGDYCDKLLPRCRILYKDMVEYLNNWKAVSILAAISLFALTATQTLYTLLAYYHRSK